MDEFSDFQMAAVQLPPSNRNVPNGSLSYYGGGNPSNSQQRSHFPPPSQPRISDSSPVHRQGGYNPSTSSKITIKPQPPPQHIFPQFANPLKPVPPPPSGNKGNIGSRLANYDLGLSVPNSSGGAVAPPTTTLATHQSNNFNPATPFPVNFSFTNVQNNQVKTSNHGNQDLLIGEEDKYSAIRLLLEADTNSSVFGNSVDSDNPSNLTSFSSNSVVISNSIPVTQPNLNLNTLQPTSNSVSAFEPSTTDFEDSDFGDFQSFTGFSGGATTSPSNSNFATSSNPVVKNSTPFTPLSSAPFSNLLTTPSCPAPLPFSQTLLPQPVTTSVLTKTEDDFDCEFGDFVSVEPVVRKGSDLTKESNSRESQLHSEYLSMPAIIPQPQSESTLLENIEDEYGGFISNSKTHSLNQMSTPGGKKDETIFDIFSNCTVAITEDNTTIYPGISKENNDIFKHFNSEGLKPQQTPKIRTPSTSTTPALPSSTFIRTSLIRNDEVTDIDSIKWNHSVEKGTEGGPVDYITYENGGKEDGKGKGFLDISPETRSVASLDLGNYVTVDDVNSSFSNNNNKTILDAVSNNQSEKSSLSFNFLNELRLPNEAHHNNTLYEEDFHSENRLFKEEWEHEKERYFIEWDRCLNASKLIISKALSIFKNAGSQEVIREVVDNEKGYSYVINILEIYHIVLRIQKSAERIRLDGKLHSGYLEINNLWEALTSYLVGTCVSDDISQEANCHLEVSSSPEEREMEGTSCCWCGVCLCPVDISEKSQYLDYGGKTYHCNCANFWVNEVDPILPSLVSYFPTSFPPSSAFAETKCKKLGS